MRISIGGSFLFLRSRKGGGAYERDLSVADKCELCKKVTLKFS